MKYETFQRINIVSIRNPQRKTLRHLTSINNTRLVNKAGYSLFELVLVILVFSTLISILIPKLEQIHDDAHVTSVRLTSDSFESAVNLTHRLWQTQGSLNEFTLLKGYGEEKIVMSKKGWPVAVKFNDLDSKFLDDGLTSKATINCKKLWQSLLKKSAPRINFKTAGAQQRNHEAVYLAEFHQGKCRYYYLLSEEKLSIEYDLATGRVIPFF